MHPFGSRHGYGCCYYAGTSRMRAPLQARQNVVPVWSRAEGRQVASIEKRCLDLSVALLSLVVLAPLLLVTALAVKCTSRGPVFHRRRVVGLGGQAFDALKFRTMRVDADRILQADAELWAAYVANFKLPRDPRITPIGRVLRRFSLDELPQLVNVLRGDMSFVGPRPERPEFVEQLAKTIPYYRARHSVKPGITGWAQLCYPYGSSELDALEKLQYDLYYVKNRTLLFDFAILVQTVEVVLWRKGAL